MIASPSEIAPSRVLVVEDNPTQAELARMLVAGLGHEVRIVETARQGFEVARSWRPAAMLLDIDLPDEDGFALMRRLDAAGIACAIVVVTANPSMEAAKDAIRAGAADYIVKPFRRERLSDVLHAALAARPPARPVLADEDGPRVLVADVAGDAIEGLLRRAGYAVRVVGDAAAARGVLESWQPDVLLVDSFLPGLDLTALMSGVRAGGHATSVVVLGAEVAEAGVFDTLARPLDAQRLAVTMRSALHRAPRQRQRFHGFIGQAPAMQAVYATIESVAASRASVFITGESGTGKELAAEAVHRASPRGQAPFVALNCAAIPRDLLESEVFGHVRGAFTGATADRTGAARLADGGTLFLDEIAEMPLDMQVKLLRFVQTGSFQPVGAGRIERVDVRFVCATNRDPLAEVQAGRFREDLFYRLHVVPLALPPLRSRGEDVLRIARHFLGLFAREEGRRFTGFAPEAEAVLAAYGWPGNVRQLQNVVRQIVVMHDAEQVSPAMLPSPIGPGAPTALGAAPQAEPEILPMAEMERRLIVAALRRTGDDVQKAAALLQINPSTIYRKLQAWRAG